MLRSDIVLGFTSFLVPGLGQFLAARFGPALVFFAAGVLAWLGPGMLASYHFSVLGENDPMSRSEFYSALAPFAFMVRLIVHSAAAYDAAVPVRSRALAQRARLRVRRRPSFRRNR